MPGQEADGDNLVMSFRSSLKIWYVECTQNRPDEAILMSAANIHFYNENKKISLNIPRYLFS